MFICICFVPGDHVACRAKDLTELQVVVQRVFDELPDSTVSGLVNSFNGRPRVAKGLHGEVPGRQPLLHARRGKRQEVRAEQE